MRQANRLFSIFHSKRYLDENISTEIENLSKSKDVFGFKVDLAARHSYSYLLGNQRIKQLKLIGS